MFVEEKKQGEAIELDETAKLLLRAIDWLNDRGWCQHSYERNGLCVMGALQVADTGKIATNSIAIDRAAARLSRHVEQSIIEWNDRPGRTKEEVIAKLREVVFSS